MLLQIRTANAGRWRLLISFQIQDLDEAKQLGSSAARLALAGGDPAELRIVDSMDVAVLHFITPLGWRTPLRLKGYTWVP